MNRPSSTQLARAWTRAVRRARFANYTPALLGKPDGAGGFVFDVPGGQGLTYVRIVQGTGVTLAHAINTAGVSEAGDAPVWLDRDAGGFWKIAEPRYMGARVSGSARCKITRATAQTIPNAADTGVTFSTESFDAGGMFTLSAADRITVTTPGIYHIAASVVFSTSAVGNIRSVRIYKNAATALARFDSAPVGGGFGTCIQASCAEMLSVGDYVRVIVYQDSGGNLDILATLGAPSLSVVQIG